MGREVGAAAALEEGARHVVRSSIAAMSQLPGGMLWIALAEGVRSDVLFDAALAHGVKIAPGSIFSNAGRFDGYIRPGCARVFDAAHEAAFDTLGRLVREAMAAG